MVIIAPISQSYGEDQINLYIQGFEQSLVYDNFSAFAIQ